MEKNARFSEMVKGSSRIYFMDLKETEKGSIYLTITESRKKEDGEYEKSRIILWENDFDRFAEGLGKVIQHHKEKADTTAG
ncbi:MAG: DUF3276 family protein [Phaeodactylibacter sp.]|nr:DUF3276 family protein [Phaeodactylibacter sp.]